MALEAPNPALLRDLSKILPPARILSRPVDRLGRSVDASIYRLIPQVVVRPKDLAEVRGLVAYARANGRHLTFRTAGTSLSGQAVTDDVLVELAPHWREHRVLDAGARIYAQPGVVGGHLNRLLARYERRIGPDPASIDAAMMGGILANNSSGMCCGVVQNTYHTLESAAFLLADGTYVDTARADADEQLRRDRPDLHRALAALRDTVRADAALTERIRRKFARKNTMGYSIHALLDYDRPADILSRLMVGSQGTLGFIAEMTLRTVPDPPLRGTALLYFAELREAGAAVWPLADAGAAAVEIMDVGCLHSFGSDRPPFPIGERTAALLVEFRVDDAGALDTAVARATSALGRFDLVSPVRFTTDAAERDLYWRLRKGLLATSGAMRPSGTAVVAEDVMFPAERLADGITDLQALLGRHGYDAPILGHAKDGNLHFNIAQDFQRPDVVERYGQFMDELCDLVVGRYDGALKAEHASGRNMAPFVRAEWGDAAYAVMKRIKRLLDPDGVFNPGVLLADDPKVHLKNLKPIPVVSPSIDKCIECGFCEPRCPSRFLTLSPRQRIVVAREMRRLEDEGTEAARAVAASLAADFRYEGLDTCAGDSMCYTSCPVKIDTGVFVKERRRAALGISRSVAGLAADRFGLVGGLADVGLGLTAALRSVAPGRALVEAGSRVLHAVAPRLVPVVDANVALPGTAPPLPPPPQAKPGARRVVYFPTCLTRTLGPLPGESAPPLAESVLDVLEWAGVAATYPDEIGSLCCGMAFSSKALDAAADAASNRALGALWEASRRGEDPVVTDASPCGARLAETARERYKSEPRPLLVFDFATFWARVVLPACGQAPRRPGAAILHPTCSLIKQGALDDLLAVAGAHAERVLVPAAAECCGFAGDRGFFVPELTAAATQAEAAEVRAQLGGDTGLYSTCRTCEIGMGRAVGRPYRSIVHLVREAVRRG